MIINKIVFINLISAKIKINLDPCNFELKFNFVIYLVHKYISLYKTNVRQKMKRRIRDI